MQKNLLKLFAALAAVLIFVPLAHADECLTDPSKRNMRKIRCGKGETCSEVPVTVCATSVRFVKIYCPSGSTITNVDFKTNTKKIDAPVRLAANNTPNEPAYISYSVGNKGLQTHKAYFTYTCSRVADAVPGGKR